MQRTPAAAQLLQVALAQEGRQEACLHWLQQVETRYRLHPAARRALPEPQHRSLAAVLRAAAWLEPAQVLVLSSSFGALVCVRCNSSSTLVTRQCSSALPVVLHSVADQAKQLSGACASHGQGVASHALQALFSRSGGSGAVWLSATCLLRISRAGSQGGALVQGWSS